MRIHTIGFTRKTAARFFTGLRGAGVKRVVDVRLNNVSQLAGFAKRDDLAFFLRELCAAGYEHRLELAPTQDMLDAYRARRGAWPTYERRFLQLMRQRKIEDLIPPETLEDACLLCSEDEPHHCHRRLVAEYLASRWQGVEIHHLR